MKKIRIYIYQFKKDQKLIDFIYFNHIIYKLKNYMVEFDNKIKIFYKILYMRK